MYINDFKLPFYISQPKNPSPRTLILRETELQSQLFNTNPVLHSLQKNLIMVLDIYKTTFHSPTTPNRYQYSLFVQAKNGKDQGYLLHILGDVQSGYRLEIYGGDDDTGVIVEQLIGFVAKELVGYAEDGRLVDVMDACEAVAPPGVQMDEMGVKIDKGTKWIRDAEWVEELILRLKAEGLITVV
jgi:hypothetical protein